METDLIRNDDEGGVPVYDAGITDKFLEYKTMLGSCIAKRLRPVIPPGASFDLHITIRRGKIMVRPTPQYVEPGFYESEAKLRGRQT